jgi:hypothetical protein
MCIKRGLMLGGLLRMAFGSFAMRIIGVLFIMLLTMAFTVVGFVHALVQYLGAFPRMRVTGGGAEEQT